MVKIADGLVLKYTDGDNNTVKLMGDLGTTLDGHTLTPYGAGGYCGKDDSSTGDDESKNVIWQILAQDNPATTDIDESTTLVIKKNPDVTAQTHFDMADYANATDQPWYHFRAVNTTVVIADGVTSIGDNAFHGFSALTSVTINAPSLTHYGSNAFKGNADGRKIFVPMASLTTYREQASTMGVDDVNDIQPIEGILLDNAENSTIIAAADGNSLDVTLLGRTLYKDGGWNTLCLPFSIGDATANDGHHFDGTTLAGATVMELDIAGTYDTDKQTGFDAATGTLYLYFKDATAIEAGKPYIVRWDKAEDYVDDNAHNLVNPVFSGVTIDNSTEAIDRKTVTSTDDKVTFTATYDAQAFTSENRSILFLGAKNTLYWPKPRLTNPEAVFNATDNPYVPVTIGVFRAYFQLNGITASDPDDPEQGGGTIRAFVLNFSEDSEAQGIMTTNYTDSTNATDAWYSLEGRKLDKAPTRKGLYIVNGRKVVVK